MFAPESPVQLISLLLAVTVLVIEIKLSRLEQDKRLLSVPVGLLMSHIIVFYLVLFLHRGGVLYIPNDHAVFGSWSAWLRVQSLITWFSLGLYRLLTHYDREKRHGGNLG